MRVAAKSELTGAQFELTDRISDLRFSNVAPGGDESASFALRAPWRAANPEVARGNLLRISDDLAGLWLGRIEEHDRGGSEAEEVAVTAYGLGARLKDSTMREVYIDRDLSRWAEPSLQRKANLIDAGIEGVGMAAAGSDAGPAGPGMVIEWPEIAGGGTQENAEAWYHAGGVDLGQLRYDFDTDAGPNADFLDVAFLGANDQTASITGTDHDQTDATDQSVEADGPGYPYAGVISRYAGAGDSATARYHAWLNLRVLGRHGVETTGDQPDEGLTAAAVIENVLGRVSGIAARRIDQTGFAITQLEFIDPATHEAAIAAVHEYHSHERTWGTWGPDSPLDASDDGRFDYVATERSDQRWLALRSDCDSISLNSELSAAFNRVEVGYRTAAGDARVATREAEVAELEGLERTLPIDGGTSTETAAQALAAAAFALSGGFVPARGQVVLAASARDRTLGPVSPARVRADGSNLRLPDVLPSATLFELDRDPERRTSFPIRRVEVTVGATVAAAIDVDQGSDWLSALQARLALRGSYGGVREPAPPPAKRLRL